MFCLYAISENGIFPLEIAFLESHKTWCHGSAKFIGDSIFPSIDRGVLIVPRRAAVQFNLKRDEP